MERRRRYRFPASRSAQAAGHFRAGSLIFGLGDLRDAGFHLRRRLKPNPKGI